MGGRGSAPRWTRSSSRTVTPSWRARFLEDVLGALRAAFPRLRRVSCYASPVLGCARRGLDRLRAAASRSSTWAWSPVTTPPSGRLDKGVDAEEMVRVAAKPARRA